VKYALVLKNIFDVLPIIVHLGLSAAVLFLCVQVNRLIAKEIFQRLYFKEELFMPTTSHLLYSNRFYETESKNEIRARIKRSYGIDLLNKDEEKENELKARKLIAGAVSQIRISLNGNKMLLQHNIEYGFWRNLIGGSLLAVCFCIAIYFYGLDAHTNDLKLTGIICFIVYLIPVLLSKLIIRSYGKYYAKILFEQFLSL
jgi:hypothetical protein